METEIVEGNIPVGNCDMRETLAVILFGALVDLNKNYFIHVCPSDKIKRIPVVFDR